MACYLNAELGTEPIFIPKLSPSPEKQTDKETNNNKPPNKIKQKECENYSPHLI